ncbi:MAG: hypothetical protein AAFR35_04220 [Pseudomonadota bacterium]
MPTHADIAAKLLRDAATFFDTLARENPPLEEQMRENATVFKQVADLVEHDPQGELGEPGDTASSGSGSNDP